MKTSSNDVIFTLSPQGMSKLNDFLPLLPIGKSTVLKLVKSGDFPQPHTVGKGTKAWLNIDILNWIESHSHNDQETRRNDAVASTGGIQ